MEDVSVGQPQGESASKQHYDPAKDPKCKAKSKDPAWKYCYWSDLNKKDVVKCILCDKIVHACVMRLKQHLVCGHGEGDDLAWAHVDEATGASSSLQGLNFPRRARFESVYSRR
jgi:hypothetical protein